MHPLHDIESEEESEDSALDEESDDEYSGSMEDEEEEESVNQEDEVEDETYKVERKKKKIKKKKKEKDPYHGTEVKKTFESIHLNFFHAMRRNSERDIPRAAGRTIGCLPPFQHSRPHQEGQDTPWPLP